MTISEPSVNRQGSDKNLLLFGPVVVDAGYAQVRVYRRGDAMVVSVQGEVHDLSSDRVFECAHAFIGAAPRMILDLSEVEFISVRGAMALIGFGAQCQQSGAAWALVTSMSVSRVLRIVSANGRWPVAESLSAAMGLVTRVDADR